MYLLKHLKIHSIRASLPKVSRVSLLKVSTKKSPVVYYKVFKKKRSPSIRQPNRRRNNLLINLSTAPICMKQILIVIKILISVDICRSCRKFKKSLSRIKVILIKNNRIFFKKKLQAKSMTPKAMLIFLTHNNILIKIPYIQIIEYIENLIYLKMYIFFLFIYNKIKKNKKLFF